MIKVIFGKKGMGKTKILVDKANSLAVDGKGSVVFIDDSNQLMYDLKHEVRFINVADFPVSGASGFMGFLCGIISQNYDIDGMLIDGLTYIVKQEIGTLESFFKDLSLVSEKFNVDFYMSINGDPEQMPVFMKEYVING